VYAKVLTEGVPGVSPVRHMPLVSLGMALAIATGKIVGYQSPSSLPVRT
jgi:hypothetical protein